MQYAYDYASRRSTVKDQRGVVHTFSYDSAGRLGSDTASTIPSGVDDAVKKIELGYDSLSRRSQVTSKDAAGAVLNEVKFTYDGWGNVSQFDQNHVGACSTGAPACVYSFVDGAVSGEA